MAVRRDAKLLSFRLHSPGEDYSSCLLPAVSAALSDARTTLEQVDVLGACTGPGSFTGIRVGLTTVKAWSELYATRIVGISRLDALAQNGIYSAGRAAEVRPGRKPWVNVKENPSAGGAADPLSPDSHSNAAKLKFLLACYNAQRGQNFAALYHRESGSLSPVGEEMVATPEEILHFVSLHAGDAPVEWVQLGDDTISTSPAWPSRAALGDLLTTSSLNLAATIAQIAGERAAKNQFTDVLQLDANYVRRSDAEIFWKGPAKRVP